MLIKAKRTQKHLTQNELALLICVSKSAVSKWERGVSYPDITLISDICRALDIDQAEILCATDAEACPCADGGDIQGVRKEAPKDGQGESQCGDSSKLHNACKWVFFGVFIALSVLLAAFLQLFYNYTYPYFLSNIVSMITHPEYYITVPFRYFTYLVFLAVLITATVICAKVFIKKTGRGEVMENKRSRPAAIIGCLFIFASVTLSCIINNPYLSDFKRILYFISAASSCGMLLCMIFKRKKLCAGFAAVQSMCLVLKIASVVVFYFFSGNDLGEYAVYMMLDTVLPLLSALGIMCFFVIKSFYPKARFNPALLVCTALTAFCFCNSLVQIVAIPLKKDLFDVPDILFYLGFALLGASEVSLRRSFLTDALGMIALPAPFIACTATVIFAIMTLYCAISSDVSSNIPYYSYISKIIYLNSAIFSISTITFVLSPRRKSNMGNHDTYNEVIQ